MCKCTPNLRTPFCGKPGCEWPTQAKPVDVDGLKLVRDVVSELSAAEYAGNIRAVVYCFIDRDGDMRTRLAFTEGQKFPLLAATVVLQRDVLNQMTQVDKTGD